MKTPDPASVTGNLLVPFIILIPHMPHPACHVLHLHPAPTINSACPTTFDKKKDSILKAFTFGHETTDLIMEGKKKNTLGQCYKSEYLYASSVTALLSDP